MSGKSASWFGCRCTMRNAFTLIELLVVITIIGLLITIILPVLSKVRFQGRKIQCIANLHSVGLAMHAYAHDFNDTIPFGPKTLSPFFSAEGNVTSLLYLYDGTPVGLGILKDTYLADQPKALFCPGTDQRPASKEELMKVNNVKRVQGDYYYRHASVALLSGVADEYHIRLSNLGKNRQGAGISALAMDVQFLADFSMSGWGVITRTAHKAELVNILLADGHVVTAGNTDCENTDCDKTHCNKTGCGKTDFENTDCDGTHGDYTVDARTSPHTALDKILTGFEEADKLR